MRSAFSRELVNTSAGLVVGQLAVLAAGDPGALNAEFRLCKFARPDTDGCAALSIDAPVSPVAMRNDCSMSGNTRRSGTLLGFPITGRPQNAWL